MVRVVSAAPHPSVVKEVICNNCGSTLEYVPRDVQERKEYDYGGGCDIVRYIQCPTCQHQVTIKRW